MMVIAPLAATSMNLKYLFHNAEGKEEWMVIKEQWFLLMQPSGYHF